jgi:hypothetical protein
MRRKGRTLVQIYSICFAFVAAANPIRAAEENAEPVRSAVAEAPTVPRHHGVFLNVGALSAVGFIGATYAYAPVDQLELEAGVGFGMSGLQLSFMPKLAIGSSRHRLLLGIGPSMGVNVDDGATSTWMNGEIGYEYRAKGGFSLAVAGGFTAGLGGCTRATCRREGAFGDDDDSTSLFSERATDYAAPQTRIAIGYWL